MEKIRLHTAAAVLLALCPPRIGQAAPPGSLWASDSLTKVMRSAAPHQDRGGPVLLAGAQGEMVSGQAVFRPTEDLARATTSISDLQHRLSDASIPARAVKLQWVRYIDVDRNTAGIPDDELVAKAPTSIPDPYWEDASIPVRAEQAQPVWIEVHVPRQAEAGDYDAVLTVAGGGDSVELPLVLHVWDFEIPKEPHLSVINWARFPGRAYRDRTEKYSEEYWSLFGEFCAFLVEHRQTDVNASLGLIRQEGDEAAGYTHDTSRLERLSEAAFAAGIRQIHLHSVGGKTGPILDPASRVKARSDLTRLAALEDMIQRRAWHGRFLVAISDEPFIHHEDSYAAVVDRVHELAPSVRCVEAVEAEYLGKLDIYVPKLSHLNLWYPRFDQARRQGAELWFYTCCHPVGRYPNRFLDQSLLKVRVLHWINYLYDLKGYLHWGLNQFGTDEPYTQEAISKGLPLGDRAIAYPGSKGLLGSLRFSAQRDGLQDYEYLWVLENRLAGIKKGVGKEAFWLDPRQRSLELCRRVIWSFHDYTRDPSVLLETRRAIAEEIEALQAGPLLVLQTSPPEGAVVPAGPRHINIRGLAPPGGKVTVNGKPIINENVKPGGYFLHFDFLSDADPTVTVAVEYAGRKRTVERTFRLTD